MSLSIERQPCIDRFLLAQINFPRPNPLPSFIFLPALQIVYTLPLLYLLLSYIISHNVARRAHTAFPYPADPAQLE